MNYLRGYAWKTTWKSPPLGENNLLFVNSNKIFKLICVNADSFMLRTALHVRPY